MACSAWICFCLRIASWRLFCAASRARMASCCCWIAFCFACSIWICFCLSAFWRAAFASGASPALLSVGGGLPCAHGCFWASSMRPSARASTCEDEARRGSARAKPGASVCAGTSEAARSGPKTARGRARSRGTARRVMLGPIIKSRSPQIGAAIESHHSRSSKNYGLMTLSAETEQIMARWGGPKLILLEIPGRHRQAQPACGGFGRDGFSDSPARSPTRGGHLQLHVWSECLVRTGPAATRC